MAPAREGTWAELAVLVDAPAVVVPCLERFYEPAERELILWLSDRPRSADEIDRWAEDRLGADYLSPNESFAWRAYRRAVIDPGPDGWLPADFHRRFEMFALFEGWGDLPEELRRSLNQWELEAYTAGRRADVETLRSGRGLDSSVVWPRYLLLDEAEALLRRVGRVFLWPCNCRSMMEACAKPVFSCLRFTNDRDLGWEISADKAIEILRAADKAGLMHSGEIGLTEDGRLDGAICNCCSDCCYPHLMADQIDADRWWPLKRYQAEVDAETCNACGLCVRRCPFEAVSQTRLETGKKGTARIETDLCRGCGLCATGCPQNAVFMRPLEFEGALAPESPGARPWWLEAETPEANRRQ
jgi:ferredoxin